jgi:hypothetical protein
MQHIHWWSFKIFIVFEAQLAADRQTGSGGVLTSRHIHALVDGDKGAFITSPLSDQVAESDQRPLDGQLEPDCLSLERRAEQEKACKERGSL